MFKMNFPKSVSDIQVLPLHQQKGIFKAPLGRKIGNRLCFGFWFRSLGILFLVTGWVALLPLIAVGNHDEHQSHSVEEPSTTVGHGHPIPGAPFKVFLHTGTGSREGEGLTEEQAAAAIQTVVDALSSMTRHRTQYQRFDEALTKNVLQTVIIEPRVYNREGKEFSFLVARTKQRGKVKLLISASALKETGYVNHPEKLIPVLAREFQWVVIKSDTAPKRKMSSVKRDLKNAPIKTNKEIREMSAEEREQVLQELFQTYLTTVDDYKSLDDQPAYEVGSTRLIPPAQPDSTTKLYDLRVRNALQLIIRDPYFQKHTPTAVRSLLNGKIWNVSFVKIDERDWATRTRVLPKDKSVTVGKNPRTIQPAKILVNFHRTAAPEDPFYSLVNGLPMGALSTDQLARVIALEIQNNITDKSMRGHVAQDEITTPNGRE
jgi:hypothetical protein